MTSAIAVTLLAAWASLGLMSLAHSLAYDPSPLTPGRIAACFTLGPAVIVAGVVLYLLEPRP